ncbi:hypothetical protein [Desulfothermobacter acidiphilus]|uniref:hypothetical protein n=1 Tax=Desulfothermobacter acidiphilus TaxID=1938353 RepID=UPI003F8A3BEB
MAVWLVGTLTCEDLLDAHLKSQQHGLAVFGTGDREILLRLLGAQSGEISLYLCTPT